MIRPALLPPRLTSVEVPRFLSPSRFLNLLGCKLSVLAEREAHVRLPLSPEAVFGLILHHLRREWAEGRYGPESSVSEALSDSLDSMARQAEKQLQMREETARLVPLRETLGWWAWARGAQRLQRWVSRAPPRRLHKRARSLPKILDSPEIGPEHAEKDLQTGQEAWIVSPRWRLRGRADQVVETRGGHYEIVDFKSGRLHDDEGNLVPESTMQVRLYALAAEESTNSPIRLFLEGSERHQVLWGRHERQETISLLREVLSDLPQGVRVSAPGIAMPGRQCAVCRVRPQCQRYIDEAPKLWKDLEIAGHLPLDTWGRIVSIQRRGTVQDVELKDPNGDLVIVRGLDTARRVDSLQLGDSIYFFGLESMEDRRSYGSVTRPRNFHEFPPDSGKRLRRAQSLLVFEGVEGSGDSTAQFEELSWTE